MKDDNRAGADRLSVPAIIRVAVSDAGWLVLLLPLSVLFRGLMAIAIGFYTLRRRSSVLAGVYALGVLGLFGWLFAHIVRLWRD